MMRTDEKPIEQPNPVADRDLWRRSRTADAPQDEASRFLDLAGFADGLLDIEEHERVAALLAADPEAAADVRAARALESADQEADGLGRVVARACAILPDSAPTTGLVVAFAPRRGRRLAQSLAGWGSIAAAIVVAGWLGFAMGSDASLALSGPRQPGDAGFLPELFDPATGFLRDLGEGLRT